jgi:hypothetical protein
VIFISLTVVRVWITVVLKEPFLGRWSNSVARLNSVFGLEKVDQKPYNSSIKPVETMQWDELRFSSGGSALETEKRMWNVKTACSTILLKFAANSRFREVHHLPREVLRKRDRHRTSTKFRLRVIRRVHELFKRPSYKFVEFIRHFLEQNFCGKVMQCYITLFSASANKVINSRVIDWFLLMRCVNCETWASSWMVSWNRGLFLVAISAYGGSE